MHSAGIFAKLFPRFTSWFSQGPVNLDYVVWNIKGSMSCTDIPFNDSSVIIIYHLLAISNGLITCLVSILYYHLPVDADNQYRSAGVLHFIYLTILSVFDFNQNSYSNTLFFITEISLFKKASLWFATLINF